jgi:thymidine kinase
MLYVPLFRQTWESVPVSKLSDLPQALIDEHELIGIDEGQFFPGIRQEWLHMSSRVCFCLITLTRDAFAHARGRADLARADVVEWCEKQANRHGKHIIVAALDGSYQRKLFGRILEVCVTQRSTQHSKCARAQLIPCAESVVKLNAVCMKCGADAPFTARTSSEVALEVIGGADK